MEYKIVIESSSNSKELEKYINDNIVWNRNKDYVLVDTKYTHVLTLAGNNLYTAYLQYKLI